MKGDFTPGKTVVVRFNDSLENVRPRFASNDCRHRTGAYSKFFCKNSSSFPVGSPLANLTNLLFRNFCARMRTPSWWCSPLLAISIFVVVVSRAKEKVRRIAAQWIVALVAHAQSILNFAIRQYPCGPVRSNGFAACETCNSIVVLLSTLPLPAVVFSTDGNFRPKTVLNWSSRNRSVVTVNIPDWLATKIASTGFCCNWRSDAAPTPTKTKPMRPISGIHKETP